MGLASAAVGMLDLGLPMAAPPAPGGGGRHGRRRPLRRPGGRAQGQVRLQRGHRHRHAQLHRHLPGGLPAQRAHAGGEQLGGPRRSGCWRRRSSPHLPAVPAHHRHPSGGGRLYPGQAVHGPHRPGLL